MSDIEHYKTSDGKGEVAHMKTTTFKPLIALRAGGKVLSFLAGAFSGGGKFTWDKVWKLVGKLTKGSE